MQIGTVFDDQALLFMAIDFILGGIEKWLCRRFLGIGSRS
jgi:hypothetical protein